MGTRNIFPRYIFTYKEPIPSKKSVVTNFFNHATSNKDAGTSSSKFEESENATGETTDSLLATIPQLINIRPTNNPTVYQTTSSTRKRTSQGERSGFQVNGSARRCAGPIARKPNLLDRHQRLQRLQLRRQSIRSQTKKPPFSHDFFEAARRVQKVEEIFGYTFTNKMLCIEALKHSSPRCALQLKGTDLPPIQIESNSRLALLGDRVLSMVLCERWFSTGSPPSQYSNNAVEMEARRALEARGRAHGFDHSCILSLPSNRYRAESRFAIAESFEAVLGAIYLDGNKRLVNVRMAIERMGFGQHEGLRKQSEVEADQNTAGMENQSKINKERAILTPIELTKVEGILARLYQKLRITEPPTVEEELLVLRILKNRRKLRWSPTNKRVLSEAIKRSQAKAKQAVDIASKTAASKMDEVDRVSVKSPLVPTSNVANAKEQELEEGIVGTGRERKTRTLCSPLPLPVEDNVKTENTASNAEVTKSSKGDMSKKYPTYDKYFWMYFRARYVYDDSPDVSDTIDCEEGEIVDEYASPENADTQSVQNDPQNMEPADDFLPRYIEIRQRLEEIWLIRSKISFKQSSRRHVCDILTYMKAHNAESIVRLYESQLPIRRELKLTKDPRRIEKLVAALAALRVDMYHPAVLEDENLLALPDREKERLGIYGLKP